MTDQGGSIRLSAAIITLNEEQNVPDLLSRLEWVDELVVIDGGSSDATVALARCYTPHVQVHPFVDYADQRNRALAMCRGEWVLSLDADERPTDDLRREVQQRIADPGDCAGFRVPIRSEILGRPFRFSGTQDDRPIRLFRRWGAEWRGAVHEVPVVEGPVGELSAWLTHRTLPDLEALLEKLNRYTSLEAQGRMRDGKPWRISGLLWEPTREVLRRLIWKKGFLDGPQGWLFCALTGFSALVAHLKHHELLSAQRRNTATDLARDRAPSPERKHVGANHALLAQSANVFRRRTTSCL